MYIYIYIYIYTHTHISIYTCVYVYIYIHMCICWCRKCIALESYILVHMCRCVHCQLSHMHRHLTALTRQQGRYGARWYRCNCLRVPDAAQVIQSWLMSATWRMPRECDMTHVCDMTHECDMTHDLWVWHDLPQTEEMGLNIITTAKISIKSSRESPYMSNMFLRKSPKFEKSFQLSKRSLRHSARKASWNIEGVEPSNQEGPGW